MYIVCVFNNVVYFIVNKPDIHVCIRTNKVILNLNLPAPPPPKPPPHLR